MEQREATILFADLRGFSSVVANYPPEVVFAELNGCFVQLCEISAHHGGTVDKFIGDAIMVVFWADERLPGDEARRAAHCALDMQIAMHHGNRTRDDPARPRLFLGIGINSGTVIAGVLGSHVYSARTVLGEHVNLAARIEAFCLRGQILLSETTYRRCEGFVDAGEPIEVSVKGHERGVAVRELHAIPSAAKRLPRQDRRGSPRAPVRFPFTCQMLANDVVSEERVRGTVIDIGYRGVNVELDHELGLLEEFKLELELPLTGYRAADLYGRVVSTHRAEGAHRFGVEFTSMSRETGRNIRKLVHLLIQGTAVE